ncbi:MAG: alpha/beta hydrolase [Pseudomonadota bacterium]|nr:alpha/beta hydrolase [Pseudomonadota bacterium]
MVFSHGFGCDQTIWRLLVPSFVPDWRVVAFDHVGSGRSQLAAYSTERYQQLEAYAEDLAEVVESLACAPVVLVGHSVGAMIGLMAANERPELFSRLVMLGPSARYLNEEGYAGGFERDAIDGLLDLMQRNQAGWAGVLAPTVVGDVLRGDLTREMTERLCGLDPTVARDFARATFLSDCRAELPRTRVPALIVQLRRDAIAPCSVGEYMQRHMPGSTLRVLEFGGHCPHLSHPAETAALIREYLATC